MKKLSIVSVALLICALSFGAALADELNLKSLDRHAVWTVTSEIEIWKNPYHDKNAKDGNARHVSTGTRAPVKMMEGSSGKFGFIQETKSYDYDKDWANFLNRGLARFG